jgi:hypothetical protein
MAAQLAACLRKAQLRGVSYALFPHTARNTHRRSCAAFRPFARYSADTNEHLSQTIDTESYTWQ